MHMVSKRDLDSAELDTVKKTLKKTDDGCNSQRRSANKRRGNNVCQRMGFSSQYCSSKIHRQFFHWENSSKITIYSYPWTTGQKPQLIEGGRRIKCGTENYVLIVVHGVSTDSSSSATPTLLTSVLQSVTRSLHPASTRSESAGRSVPGTKKRGIERSYSLPFAL